LYNIADGCRNVLNKLEKTLDKYGELGTVPEGVGKRVKRVWKRLKWEPEDIRELRSRISSNITLLNAFNGQLTRDNTVKLVQHQNNQERRTILDWLTPTDYSAQQSDFIGRRQDGTGHWLLDSDEFQSWLNKDKQTLFCPGIPGAGKTMIASIVVDHLNAKFSNVADIGIAYIYCNYQPQQEQKPEDLLSSLLKQLAQEQPALPADVKDLYERHSSKRSRPSLNEIVKALHSTVLLYSRIFIIVDALDEYHVSNSEGQKKLLSDIFNLQYQAQVNLFATSRFISEIISQFEGCLSKEIRAQDDDILKYINGRMPQLLRSKISKCPEYTGLQNTIRSDIVKAADGMYAHSSIKIQVSARLTWVSGFSLHGYIWISS
jgi:hypothetical protein